MAEIKSELGLDTVIDLSDRPRPVVENWCRKNGATYIKVPINEYSPSVEDFKAALSAMSGKTLVHCFRGIHRTGAFLTMWQIDNGHNAEKVIFDYSFKCNFTHPKLVEMVKSYANGK